MSDLSLNIVYFLITSFASTIGAICGIGGGVIIKPILDSLGIMSVSAISFLSGCTVLAMSSVSLMKSLKKEIKLHKEISIFLSLGAVIGGTGGKSLFQFAKTFLGSDRFVGIIQAALLLGINIVLLLYMRHKSNINGRRQTNAAMSIVIGLLLGVLSSFLGIGGGPINIIVLYYFYSLRPKETVLNSLFIIFCSQAASLTTSLMTQSVPAFMPHVLAIMCLGAISGSLLGNKISSKVSEQMIEKIFCMVLVLLIMINIYNIIHFLHM
jgi:uncharacterized membrane protein YfcA